MLKRALKAVPPTINGAPNEGVAAKFVDSAMLELGRAAAVLHVDGATQDPTYYRANQLWRLLDEFQRELRRRERS